MLANCRLIHTEYEYVYVYIDHTQGSVKDNLAVDVTCLSGPGVEISSYTRTSGKYILPNPKTQDFVLWPQQYYVFSAHQHA